MQNFTIEHRLPKAGELYICDPAKEGGSLVYDTTEGKINCDVRTAAFNLTEPRIIIVPVVKAWPDPPVIVIEESPDVDLDLLPVVAIRDHNGDYIHAGHSIALVLREGRDSITAWHEYAPDGYVPQEKVYEAAAQGAAAAAPEPLREYTADDLDNLPAGGCFWDEDDYVWQKIEGVWQTLYRPADGNPLLTGTIIHAYSAPKH